MLATPSPMNRPDRPRGIRVFQKGFPKKSWKNQTNMKYIIQMMNSTAKLSMVAMRVWVKCIRSKAISSAAAMPPHQRFANSLPSKYMPGSISTPASAPANRQPKGVMPKMAMHQLMNTLPNGGWVVS